MELSFKNKKIIVTGGSAGLGRAIVEAFLADGANVATCARHPETLDELKRKYGDQIFVKRVDLMRMEDTKDFMELAAKKFGGIDTLVFNPPHSVKVPISKLTLDDWHRSFDAIYSCMLVAVAVVIPKMAQARKGSVVVVSSLAAIEPIDSMAASSVLRSGVASWVKLMTREYGPKGLRFNAVMPGFMDTPAVRKTLANLAKEQGKSVGAVTKALVRTVPLRRLGTARDVAQAVMFLASDVASFISGTTLLVDGGLVKGV